MFRVAWLLSSVLFIAFAGSNLVGELASSRLKEFALSVESSATLPSSSPGLEDRIRRQIAELVDCRRQVARSRVTAALFSLRRRITDVGGVDINDPLFADVRSTIIYGLTCDPLDGNLWLLAGWFARIAGNRPPAFDQALAMSIATAPIEGEVLVKRWTLIAPILPLLGLSKQAVLPDLANLLTYADTKAATSILLALRGAGAAGTAEAALSLISVDRRVTLAAAIAQTKERALGSEKFHLFEFTEGGPVRREEP